MTEKVEKRQDQNTPGAVDPTAQRIPDSQRGLNNPDPNTGETALQIEQSKAKDNDFKHGEIVVQARSLNGFNRAGYRFSGQEKTIIPANTLSEQRYNAIMNETQLVAIEKPSAEFKEGASEAQHSMRPAPHARGEFALGGSQENATPEQLAAEARGESMGHPSFGSTNPTGASASRGYNQHLDQDFVKASEEAKAKNAKKAEKKADKEK